MRLYTLSLKSRKPIFVGVGMFIVLLALTQILAYFWYQAARYSEIRRLTEHANAKKELLHITLTNSMSSTRTLAFIVEEYGVPADFDRLGEKLLKANRLVDAIQLVQGGVITHVFPMEGNEAAVGYDILSDTIRHSGALIAMRTKDFFFAGPVKLKQGGIAVIGRQPIFINKKFWGFAAVLIKLSNFIEAANIDADNNSDFKYQLARVHRETGDEEFFLPSIDVDIHNSDNVVTVEVPNSEWRLYVAILKQGEAYNHAWLLSVLGLLFSSVVSAFSWHKVAQNSRLREIETELKASNEEIRTTNQKLSDLTDNLEALVRQKTAELQTYIDAVNVNIFSAISDLNGVFTMVNDHIIRISGYSREELLGRHYNILSSGGHPEQFFTERRKVLMTGKAWRGEVEHKTKDGTILWFDCVVIPMSNHNGDVKNFLTLGLPITERKQHEKIKDATQRLLEMIAFRASHNIRGPMARIKGLSDLIQHDLLDEREYKELASKFKTCTDELSAATEELVDFVCNHQELLSQNKV